MADIQALDGLQVEESVLRVGELTPGLYAEQYHFKLHIEIAGALSDLPILQGLSSLGRASQHIPGWIDGFYGGSAFFDGEPRDLAGLGLAMLLFRSVGAIIAPGGWLGLAYETLGEDTELLQETRQLLDLGVPPIVTPLGLLLNAAGCGLHIRNWYISEGWREGPRKLQGYKPVHDKSRRARSNTTAQELQRFLAEANPADELAHARERAAELLNSL